MKYFFIVRDGKNVGVLQTDSPEGFPFELKSISEDVYNAYIQKLSEICSKYAEDETTLNQKLEALKNADTVEEINAIS